MTTTLFPVIVAAILVASSSCKNKAQKDAEDYMNKIEKTMKENPVKTDDQQKTNSGTATIPQEMENIIGEWDLVGSVVDTNDNLQLDEDEKKKLTPAAYKDYMKLNRNGSGLFTVAKMDGRYEITTRESDGKKYLTWYDEANGQHRVGTIINVTKDELHIKEPGGSGLFLWKRS